MAVLVGIDLGTTTARCVLFDERGREIRGVYREGTIDFPRPLWAEVPPERWWTNIARVVRETLDGYDGPIAGVGVSGLMHAPVLLDDAGAPVVPAQLWMDQRSAAQAAAINRERGIDPHAAATGGARAVQTTVSAPKLRWLSECQPELFRRARHLMLPKDYIRFRLCGVVGTDRSDAGGTGLWDREREEWDWAAVDAARVPRSLVPDARDGGERAGSVTAEAAAVTGLPVGTPVAVGGSDVYCTRIAVGPMQPGDACNYMGTATWIAFVGEVKPDGTPVARSFGSTSTTGAALRWARDVLVGPGDPTDPGASYERFVAEAEPIEPGAEGLICIPHLMGERGPRAEPKARGAFIGLTLRHGRAHLIRALLEGTALQIRRLFDERGQGLVQRAITAGGAARSPLWMQILADVTGVPILTPRVTETSVLGAAMLGGVAAGEFDLRTGMERMVQMGARYAADPERQKRYDALYAQYRELDEMLLPWYRKED